jgi:hypothetical protein
MSWNRILRLCLLPTVLAGVLCQSVVSGDEPAKPNIKVRKLTVFAAPEPVPALKYRLLPTLLERKAGNAAVLHNRVLTQFADLLNEEEVKKIGEWADRDLPPEKLPVDELRQTLERLDTVLVELAVAARRDSCEWDVPFDSGQNPFTVLLPELQQQRQLARALVVRIRLAILDGRIDDAIEDLKTGFAFARDIGKGPTLIHGLVGIAISGILLDQVEELSQQPDAPNLYWALAAMPRPLIDLRPGLETEMHVLDLWMPDLRDLDAAGNDPNFWEAKLKQVADGIRDLAGDSEPEAGYRTLLTMLALKGYPKAVNYMVSRGHTQEEVAAMHPARVMLIATVENYRRQRDAAFKWYHLPYHEAREGALDWEEQFNREGRDNEVLPLASMILPAIGASKLAVARHHRSLEVARLIEAIRMHLATEGKLPAHINDITVAPVPTDPIWGKPFDVSRHGDTLVIESAPVPSRNSLRHGLRIEVQVAE